MVRHHTRVRLIAGLLACAWTLLPLGTLVDALATEHVYCAEHNAIEHAADGAAEGAASLPVEPRSEGFQAGNGAPDEHGDSCPFTQIPPTVTRAPVAQLATCAPPALAIAPVAIENDTPPLPILAVAPKSSPPA